MAEDDVTVGKQVGDELFMMYRCFVIDLERKHTSGLRDGSSWAEMWQKWSFYAISSLGEIE